MPNRRASARDARLPEPKLRRGFALHCGCLVGGRRPLELNQHRRVGRGHPARIRADMGHESILLSLSHLVPHKRNDLLLRPGSCPVQLVRDRLVVVGDEAIARRPATPSCIHPTSGHRRPSERGAQAGSPRPCVGRCERHSPRGLWPGGRGSDRVRQSPPGRGRARRQGRDRGWQDGSTRSSDRRVRHPRRLQPSHGGVRQRSKARRSARCDCPHGANQFSWPRSVDRWESLLREVVSWDRSLPVGVSENENSVEPNLQACCNGSGP